MSATKKHPKRERKARLTHTEKPPNHDSVHDHAHNHDAHTTVYRILPDGTIEQVKGMCD